MCMQDSAMGLCYWDPCCTSIQALEAPPQGGLPTMDENSGRYIGRSGGHAFSGIPIRSGCYGLLRPLRSETNLYFPKNFKIHNKTYFFSCSLQITFLFNSSTILYLKEHQKAHDLTKLQSILNTENFFLGTSYQTPLLVDVLFSLDTLKS